ncbi:MAG: hypothetical protein IT232_00410, partial [Flavobacteriales bacterium]|nr:hypothetical protein [Flavobacteriales bacterium]
LCKKIGESGVFYNSPTCSGAATSTRVCQPTGTFDGDVSYAYSRCDAGVLTNLLTNPVDLKVKKTNSVLNPVDGPLSIRKDDLVTVNWGVDVKTAIASDTVCTKSGGWSGTLTGLTLGINSGLVDVGKVSSSQVYTLTCVMKDVGTYYDNAKVNVTSIVEF